MLTALRRRKVARVLFDESHAEAWSIRPEAAASMRPAHPEASSYAAAACRPRRARFRRGRPHCRTSGRRGPRRGRCAGHRSPVRSQVGAYCRRGLAASERRRGGGARAVRRRAAAGSSCSASPKRTSTAPISTRSWRRTACGSRTRRRSTSSAPASRRTGSARSERRGPPRRSCCIWPATSCSTAPASSRPTIRARSCCARVRRSSRQPPASWPRRATAKAVWWSPRTRTCSATCVSTVTTTGSSGSTSSTGRASPPSAWTPCPLVSPAAEDPAWQSLKEATNALRAIQAPEGEIDAARRGTDAARAGVEAMIESIGALAPRFPHQRAYLEQVPADLRAWADGRIRQAGLHGVPRPVPPGAGAPRRHRAPRRVPDVHAERLLGDSLRGAHHAHALARLRGPARGASATTTTSSCRSSWWTTPTDTTASARCCSPRR